MIKSDKGNVEINGKMSMLIVEIGTAVDAVAKLLSNNSMLTHEQALETVITACYKGSIDYHNLNKNRP